MKVKERKEAVRREKAEEASTKMKPVPKKATMGKSKHRISALTQEGNMRKPKRSEY